MDAQQPVLYLRTCSTLADQLLSRMSIISYSFAEVCAIVIVLISTLIVVAVITLVIRAWRLQKELASFPEMPDRHWLLGHMHKVTFDEREIAWGTKMVNKLSHAAVMWVGPFLPVVTLFHHETIKAILSTGEPKAEYTYSFVRPWIGDGLLLANGKKWSRNRRLLTPGFHFDILKPYVNIFQQSADILVNKWRSACNGEPKSMEMFSDISLLMLDSLLKCIFSVESNCQTVTNHPYIQGIYEIATLVTDRFRFLPFHVDMIYQWSPSGRRYRRAYESVHDYARDIIEKRKKALADEQTKGRIRHTKYVDFLDILLCAKDSDGNGLSDQEIYDEVDTFMFEGHDTTSAGTSWFLYNMARFPEFQQKCRDEIDELLADRACDKLEWDDLNCLPYLTKCLKESLRFHPPVNLIMRSLTQPLTFSDGRTLPKGAFVTVAINGLHHNKNVWEDPEVFDPERFSPDRAKSIPPFAYVPFSAGPRNCIGQNFALNEMKVIAAMILRNFHLSLNESIPVMRINTLVLRAEKGINLYITPRKQ